MNNNQNLKSQSGLKSWIPVLLPIIGFLLISFAYFNPVLQGKIMYQHDIFQGEGAAKELMDFRAKTGTEALWTNSMFGGMPSFQLSTLYPANLFANIDYFFNWALPHPINLVFKLFLGFYFLLIVLKVDPWLSGIGGFAFAFSSYFFIALEAGHNSKVGAMGYVPPVIAGFVLAYNGKHLLGAAITAISLALQIYSNHFQITYYLFLMLGCLVVGYFIYAIIDKSIVNFIKASVFLVIGCGIGFGPNISQFWSTLDYSAETIRGKSELAQFAPKESLAHAESGLDKDYAFRWSYGKWETTTLLLPNSVGGSSQGKLSEGSETYSLLKKLGVPNPKKVIQQWPTYWGDQPFTSGPVYVGAIICFLFVLGLILGDNRYRWWLLAATVMSIVMSWGRNYPGINYFLFDHLPMYNKFRAPAMILVIAEFAMPLLGFLTLSGLMNVAEEKKIAMQKKVLIAAGILGGFLLMMLLLGSAMLSFSTGDETSTLARMFGMDVNNPDQAARANEFAEALIADRTGLFRMDLLKALAYVAIAAAVIWLFLKGSINKYVVYAAIAGLIVVDLWSVNQVYLGKDSFEKPKEYAQKHQPEEWNKQILQDTDIDYRVLNLADNTFNDSKTSYFHKSVGGYHAAKLRRYQDMIENHFTNKLTMGVVNMLNTKYVVQKGQEGKYMVQKNPAALGNAWFVENILWVNNAREEIDTLTNFDPSKTAVADIRFKEKLSGFSGGKDSASTIVLKSYQPNDLIYESNSASPGMAVFSEIFYDDGKGWQAYLDGNKVTHARVNYILRGMLLPAGAHKIEFKFEPRAYYTGEKISLGMSFFLIIGLLGVGFIEFRRKKEANNE